MGEVVARLWMSITMEVVGLGTRNRTDHESEMQAKVHDTATRTAPLKLNFIPFLFARSDLPQYVELITEIQLSVAAA
jgi:hypothetical protein